MSDDIVERITGYLAGGGLFNPELANHDAVRDLLIDARDALAAVTAERDRMRILLTRLYDAAGPLDADKMPADDFAQIITIVLDARAALEVVTEKSGAGNE